uniref:Uncharacterized protein n=1 Tax=Rhodnius prolixus TaxID=13249 RepID=T1HTP9_RHOPR
MPSPLLVFCTIMLVNLCLWQIALGRELHMETIIAGPRDECKENVNEVYFLKLRKLWRVNVVVE